MFRSHSFKNREVINIDTAERIGIVSDVEIDEVTGSIRALIVKRHGSFLSTMLGGELIIPWSSIAVMGEEIVLVRAVELIV